MKSIQRKGLKLVTASAFYKNDLPGGIGIHYPTPPKDFIQMIDTLLLSWDANATPERIHEQLKEIGDYIAKDGKDEKTSLIAFVDIVWLESRGHLVPDEYNGGYWQWTAK